VHATLPRGERVRVDRHGSLEQILHGPAHDASGSVNLCGALRRAMALCGFETIKDLQKAELVVVGQA
jgi:IMP dehydrogenase